MALVKTTKIGASTPADTRAEAGQTGVAVRRAPMPRGGGRDKIIERLAAATEELASGLSESAAAAEELRRSMEQIAAGAEEAAGGSQEQLAAIKNVVGSLDAARSEAETSRRRTETVQAVLAETTAQIAGSVRSIERNAERQNASVALIDELDRQAQDIGAITQVVSRLSDQTNLLALNAAIEAARAGEQGRGFAVVAEEVRALAEVTDRSAQDVQDLAGTIQAEVRGAAEAVKGAASTATDEAKAGGSAIDVLAVIRSDMDALAQGSEDILTAAMEAQRAAVEAQRGAELVASEAEEQAAAAAEAQTGIRQQSQALDQGQVAAQSLAASTMKLAATQADVEEAEQIAATAEQLSAMIQELSSAATQITAAVEQIDRGAQQQAAATQQTSAALAQIEASAGVAQRNASAANERAGVVGSSLTESRAKVERLVRGVTIAVEAAQQSLATIQRLEKVGRRIEKIVDGIALVAMQTTMLAVSGSVEAARAGEAGRGFAVVSNDIRTLAREASGSVEKIKDTVRGILDQIGSLRRDLEQTVIAGEVELQSNRAIFGALEKLDSDVAAMRAGNQAILASSEVILLGATQSAAAARQIAVAAEEASSASRQAATAALQQAQGAEDLAAAIEEIALMADELKSQNG